MNNTPLKSIEVVAGILHDHEGRILLGQRAPGTFYPGYWEFPGGKIEPSETAEAALIRELREELDIEAISLTPWITREHTYEHAHVLLHFFHVRLWQGQIKSRVHTQLAWESPLALTVGPALPTTVPVFKSLKLPEFMGITHAWHMGCEVQLKAIDTALQEGLRLIQIREGLLTAEERVPFAKEVCERARDHNALVFFSGSPAEALTVKAPGLHLSSSGLWQHQTRPDFEWVGASCHSRQDLEHAAQLDLDYALLGHILPTPSHPGQPGLGWEKFAHLILDLPFPVFAIGGLTPALSATAQKYGAHGVAAIRGAWGGLR